MCAQESAKKEYSHVVEHDMVDELLDDARQNPEAKAPVVKPVTCVEFWLKKIGACILINCIEFKHYITQYIHGHEKKDSN